MKTLTLFFAFLFSIAAYSQSSDYKIMPVQSGSANLINGKATVMLDDITVASLSGENKENTYFVVLTPVGSSGSLKLNEKNAKSFIVAMTGSGSENGSFDYIVFLKYHIVPINTNTKPVFNPVPAQGK